MSSTFDVRRARLIAALLVSIGTAAPAAAQMPDPSQMSGVPLPSPELPVGTLTVRVVRGSLGDNVDGQTVALRLADGGVREAATDAGGRATFDALAPGTQVQATTVVDGTRLESQVIAMPAEGGVRVMLFAPAAAVSPDAPVASGDVSFSEDSRFIVEHGDEALNVFYILEIANAGAAPVAGGGPLLFDLPSGATGATLLAGSTPQATVGGSRVTVTGPFAPGKTSLQIAYSLPVRGGRVTVEQAMPAALPRVAVAGETTGGVTMTSPQFTASRDMTSDGRAFLVGNGPGLQAGETLTLTFEGLPHHPRWPRFTAFGAAVAIMALGLAFAFARPPASAAAADAGTLASTREARFAEIERLEAQRAAGAIDEAQYREERARLVAALEDVYAALDAERR